MSSLAKKSKKTLFSIHLVETEGGQISVLTEFVGTSMSVYELGLEIMHNLDLAAAENPGHLVVQPLPYCTQFQ